MPIHPSVSDRLQDEEEASEDLVDTSRNFHTTKASLYDLALKQKRMTEEHHHNSILPIMVNILSWGGFVETNQIPVVMTIFEGYDTLVVDLKRIFNVPLNHLVHALYAVFDGAVYKDHRQMFTRDQDQGEAVLRLLKARPGGDKLVVEFA